MLIASLKKVLVLAPHTDDGELGCGGTIARMIENGIDVYYVAFSACEISVPDGFPKDILIREVKQATNKLGIKPENLKLLKYDVRTFNYHRQAILDDILNLKKEIAPDLIFIPALHDIHQDHATIANEAFRAFKFSNILCYELPWNNLNFNTTLFVKLEERHIEIKKTAMREYKSQAHRSYANDLFIQSLAITRGVQSGNTYAEVFEVIRLIM